MSCKKLNSAWSISHSLARLVLLMSLVIAARPVAALPPLGLTLIDPSVDTSPAPIPRLEIIAGTAYVSDTNRVWPVDSFGTKPLIAVTHPILGVPYSLTHVVDGPGGLLCVGANFGSASPNPPNLTGAALYQLAAPHDPVVTWPAGSQIDGVSADLRILGDSHCCSGNQFITAAQFFQNGSVSSLPLPAGTNFAAVWDVSRSGFGLGNVNPPGSAGDGSLLWTPNNQFSFVNSSRVPSSLRDRSDEDGVNVGMIFPSTVFYGSQPPVSVLVRDETGEIIDAQRVIVSQGDFTVIDSHLSQLQQTPFYGYYPGASPSHPDRAVPLTGFFPQLSTINIASIDDLASVEGYLYMTLRTTDGALYLFGARDPSAVPEAASIILALIALPFCCARRRIDR